MADSSTIHFCCTLSYDDVGVDMGVDVGDDDVAMKLLSVWDDGVVSELLISSSSSSGDSTGG